MQALLARLGRSGAPAPPGPTVPRRHRVARGAGPTSPLPLTLVGASPAPGAAPLGPLLARDPAARPLAMAALAFALLQLGPTGRQAGCAEETTSCQSGSRGRRGLCAPHAPATHGSDLDMLASRACPHSTTRVHAAASPDWRSVAALMNNPA